MEEHVKMILGKIRPYINRDGGDVEFVKIEDNIAYIKFSGACIDCGISNVTFGALEEILLEEVPGIIGVEEVKD